MPIMDEHKISAVDAWTKSRSGAWAGRGFHFQHLFSTLILIRQWAGLSPSGNLVPEGLEDCVVELPSEEFWLQVKSRKDGEFSEAEVKKILKEVTDKEGLVQHTKKRKVIIALEQACSNRKSADIDELFNDSVEQVLVCTNPHDAIIEILLAQLNTAEIIAEGILSDIYKLVATASEENASLPFNGRRRISTTEIERRIFERLEAEDPSAIDHALASGILEPIDFSKPVNEPVFYQGVKASPGHVVSGLVLNRPVEKNQIISSLKKRRHVLISGQSGAGKSALMWLTIKSLAGDVRWYQVNSSALTSDADSIIRFLRSRRPSEISPIGLALDEIGSINADIWNILARELRSMPDVYFLGSVRKEDAPFICNQSDVEIIEVSLSEPLAESVWSELHSLGQTKWEHWREPFEQSDGLMLEYIHILTQGKRLATVINDQVRRRLQENRYNELAILRVAATLCASGGDVQASKLIDLLGINSNEASKALTHLLDEHLVRESRPGVLGGLHILRSNALVKATHDQVLFLTSESLWQGLLSVTNDTLPRVIQSVLVGMSDEEITDSLQKLSNLLDSSQEVEVWIAILRGLGIATLERNVASFIDVLKQYEVQRAQWAFASMFGDSETDLTWLNELEPMHSIRDAILAFRNIAKQDLRRICLAKLSNKAFIPVCKNFNQANKLLSCLAPICGDDPININIPTPLIGKGELNIDDVSDFLASAYLISPDLSKKYLEDLGGEEVLFNWFVTQTPWVTFPKIDPKGEHGRTVRSDFCYVSDDAVTDMHESVCDTCKTLIAISPSSMAAASDAITPLGEIVTAGGYRHWSKNMPRKNIPAKTRISWNITFRQILLARSISGSLTTYTNEMSSLVKRTEKVFRLYSEKWIRGKRIVQSSTLIEEVNQIVQSVNDIAYSAPEKLSHDMTEPASGMGQDDSLGALLTGILGNLIRRMSQITGDGNPKATAVFAGDLARQAYEHERSIIWRVSLNPPKKELAALSVRLNQVSQLLHEFAFDNSDATVQKIINFTKKSSLSKAVSIAASRCQLLARHRFDKKLQSLEKDLKGCGWDSKCWSIAIDEPDSAYWPAREVSILVDISDFEIDIDYLELAFQYAEIHLENNWRFRVVPVINGFVVAPLAMLLVSQAYIPDLNFTKNWQHHITIPFMSSQIIEQFDKALGACVQISGILACRDLEKLHVEEEKVLNNAIELFKHSHDFISAAAEREQEEHIICARNYINQYWNFVVEEFEAAEEGQKVECPICISDHHDITDRFDDIIIERAAVRIRMMKAECLKD